MTDSSTKPTLPRDQMSLADVSAAEAAGWHWNTWHKRWEEKAAPEPETPEETYSIAEIEQALVIMSREDPVRFNEYVLKDEKTGNPITMAPFQIQLVRDCNSCSRLNVITPPEHGKTQNISVGLVLWLIGRNPNIRICIVHRTAELAQKILMSIRKYIEHDPEYHRVFPHVKKGDVWKEDRINVQRKTMSKDFTVVSVGTPGPVEGARYDLIIMDDPLSEDNTATELQRQKTFYWCMTTLFNRKADGGRVVVLNNAWHPEDLSHQLMANRLWKTTVLKAYDEQGNPLWGERWTKEKLDEKREEIGSYAFTLMFLSDASVAQGGLIKPEWIRFEEPADESILIYLGSCDPATGDGPCDFAKVDFGFDPVEYKLYVMDAQADKYSMAQREALVSSSHARLRYKAVPYEVSGQQAEGLGHLREKCRSVPFVAICPVSGKAERLRIASIPMESGMVFFHPRLEKDHSSRTRTNNLVEALLTAKPKNQKIASTNPDLCDAFSQGINWAMDRLIPNAEHEIRRNSPKPRDEVAEQWAASGAAKPTFPWAGKRDRELKRLQREEQRLNRMMH